MVPEITFPNTDVGVNGYPGPMREQVPPRDVEPQPKIPCEPLIVMDEFESAAFAMEPLGRITPPPETVRPLFDCIPFA